MTSVRTGHDLKVERIRAGLSQVELGARIGVSGQRISNVEALTAVPDSFTARVLAALEGVTVRPSKRIR